MILDSSAIVAIALDEPGTADLLAKLDRAEVVAIGAPTLVETAIVLRARFGRDPRPFLERFLSDWGVTVIPFGEDHWKAAWNASAQFGRGRHRAALNFGDCLAYAVAKLAGLPLLCTGTDFARSDLTLA